MKKEHEQLDEIFANGETLNLFTDGVERKIHPVTMKNFGEFMKNLTSVNSTDLWVNFLQDDTEKALKKVLSLSFDEKIDDLQNVINAKNYAKLMQALMSVNGISIAKKGESEGNDKKKV